MRFIPKDVGGEIDWYAPSRPAAGPTVQVLDDQGAVLVAAGTAAALDSVDTTLAQGAARGAVVLELVSGASVAAGRRYALSQSGSITESVLVESVSGVWARLRDPLAHDHPASSAFQGTRISYAVTAGQAATTGDHRLAIFSWSIGATAQAPQPVEFAVSLRAFANPLDPAVLRRYDPDLLAKVPGHIDLVDLCDLAFHEVADRVTARGVPLYDYRGGSAKLERACAYAALLIAAETYGEAYSGQREYLAGRRDELVQVFAASAAADVDRDGVIDAGEERGQTGARAVGRRQ